MPALFDRPIGEQLPGRMEKAVALLASVRELAAAGMEDRGEDAGKALFDALIGNASAVVFCRSILLKINNPGAA